MTKNSKIDIDDYEFEDQTESSEKSSDLVNNISKTMKKVSRDSDPYKGKRRGGLHGTPKGKKGYDRKEKHKKSFSFWVASDLTSARPCGDGSKGGETYPEKCVGPGSQENTKSPEESTDWTKHIKPPDTSHFDRPKIEPAAPKLNWNVDQERDQADQYLANNMDSYRDLKRAATQLGLHDEEADQLALDLEDEEMSSGEGASIMVEHYMNKWEQKFGSGSAQSGQQLTPMDETYRHMKFPLATASWFGTPWEKKTITALLDWSTHKAETFDDTGEKGEHPAWGMKSIIDRGVKPHEKSNGDKRIGEAENQVQLRKVKTKNFKSFSAVDFLHW